MELQDPSQSGGPRGRERKSAKASWRQGHANTNSETVSFDHPSAQSAQPETTSSFSRATSSLASSLASAPPFICPQGLSEGPLLTQTDKPMFDSFQNNGMPASPPAHKVGPSGLHHVLFLYVLGPSWTQCSFSHSFSQPTPRSTCSCLKGQG